MKHIHIYLHAATQDFAYSEGDHPRNPNGQFRTTFGNASAHQNAANEHLKHAIQKGKGHAEYSRHSAAMSAHKKAAFHLREAQGAHMENKSTGEHVKRAQSYAYEAETHQKHFDAK
jgi:hypothetical protein